MQHKPTLNNLTFEGHVAIPTPSALVNQLLTQRESLLKFAVVERNRAVGRLAAVVGKEGLAGAKTLKFCIYLS